MKKIFLKLLSFLFVIVILVQQLYSVTNAADDLNPIIFGGTPQGSDSYNILVNDAFIVAYDESRRNPAWVAYRVPGTVPFTEHKRVSRFITDNRTGSKINHNDYTNSGFSRGHMAPSFAIYSRFGKDAQRQTYYMSNICPQYQEVNGGPWQRIEEYVAGKAPDDVCWSKLFQEVWIFTGPIYDSDIERIKETIEIPDAFYKIIIDIDVETMQVRVLSFIIPNHKQVHKSPIPYLRSVDEVERQTHLDFLWKLDNEIEIVLEQTVPTELWDFN